MVELNGLKCRSVAALQKSEPHMRKSFLGAAQDVLSAIWKAVRPGRPPTSKVKLDGRRGYGDGGIPSPDQKPDGP